MNKENKSKTKASPGPKQTAAQETANITLLLKRDKDTVVTLYVCVQPLDGYAGVSPYAWFEDVHLKELVGVAQEVLQNTPVEAFQGDEKPQHQLKRGENTRILFVFNETGPFPFHILVPSKSYSPASEAPTVAFLTEHGRRVFPFVEHTTKGGGFKLLHMQKNVLCAYVDCYEGDSPLGVFKIMKNLEFRVQPHSVTELKSGTHLDQGIVKPPAGKKAGAKRKKGKQLSTTKKSRQSDVEGQLAGNKNTILPFTRKQPQEQGEGMEEEEEEDGEEREETSNDVGETGKSEGRVEMGEGEVEKEETKTPKDDAPDLKQKANSLLYTTPHNTRYGLRNRAMPSSVWEPSPTKVKRQRTQPTDANATEAHKDISLDSGKAASQDSVVSSLVECTEDKESTGTSQENQAPTGASQAERESIFCSTPVQPSRSVVVGSCQLTPMQMLVAHLPNDEEEDLQGYLSQQVDSEASAEVPDICIISDVEEGEEVSEVAAKPKKGKRRAVEQDPKKLFAGKSLLSQLTRPQLMRWMQANKPLIVLLFQGKEHSRRHNDFLSGIKKRAALHHQVDLRLFTHDQIQTIGKALMDIFCAKGMKYFGYVMSVIFPECLIRIIADFYQVDFKSAEEMMFNPQLATERPKGTAKA
ncbi:hypothetical protein EMCRGX_G032563 [Ephydatia muelleri]